MPDNDDDIVSTTVAADRAAVPRFLFRYWNTASGGDPLLNTTHQITPSAFRSDAIRPPSKHDDDNKKVSKTRYDADFISRARHHLLNQEFGGDEGTPFSSWSISLAHTVAFGFAKDEVNGKPHLHGRIAVLDTNTCPRNTIMHTRTLNIILSDDIPSNPWEYLIYGTIQGSSYASVPWADLKSHIAEGLCRANIKLRRAGNTMEREDIIQNAFKHANDAGQLFPRPYRRVITTSLLGVMDFKIGALQEVAMFLGYSDIPHDWTQDEKLIDLDRLEFHGVIDALRAAEVMRATIVLANDRGGRVTASTKVAQGIKEARRATMEEAEVAATEHPKASVQWHQLKAYSAMLWLAPVIGEVTTPHRWLSEREEESEEEEDEEMPLFMPSRQLKGGLRVVNVMEVPSSHDDE